MIRHLRLRGRVTLVVTAVFAVALVAVSFLALAEVRRRLEAGTLASAAQLLDSYLVPLYSGTVTAGAVDPSQATRFFYRDADGNEISETAFFEALVPDSLVPPIDPELEQAFDEVLADLEEAFPEDATVLPEAPIPTSEIRAVDAGPEFLAVAQQLSIGGGQRFEIGLSSPTRPIDDSLAAIRQLLWFGVPLLVAGVGAATWIVAGRVLRPVDDMTARVEEISHTKLSERIPVPASDDEISRLAMTMNGMLDRLERSQQRQRRLVSDAAHELRSPVAASQTQLEVARAADGEADWPATADTVLAEQHTLGQLIDDLLALSRLDETGIPDRHDVDLDDLVSAEAARPRQVPVDVAITRPVRISGNTQLLARALRNLVDNAARHAGSLVTVTLDTFGGQARISVDDDGPGVPPVERERVFERFARADHARNRATGGAGLGLAIVRDVVVAHGGRVEVVDSPCTGARFVVNLPLEPR